MITVSQRDGSPMQKEIDAKDLAARCNELLEELAMTGRPIVITKDGAPVARLVSAARPQPRSVIGRGIGAIALVDPDDDLDNLLTSEDVAAWYGAQTPGGDLAGQG